MLGLATQATKSVAGIAEKCMRLRGLVHVSTAYVNCNVPRGSHIQEEVYPLRFKDGTRVLHNELASQFAALSADAAEKQVGMRHCLCVRPTSNLRL